MSDRSTPQEALEIARSLSAMIDRVIAARGGDTTAIRPGHRVKFHWPPHPISYEFHVLASDWTGEASFEAYGETFPVRVARTPYGVFGRCDAIWHEARGETLEEMLRQLQKTAEPLFQRQLIVGRTLERPGRFTGHISELSPLELLTLLYCEDRDVASEARSCIEARASSRLFLPGLLTILDDRRHPMRRSAQWSVLDLFEDLPSFAEDEAEEVDAVRAMRNLIWDAEDDYARTIYKAGVVLGGHIPDRHGGPTLLECLDAPSKIGRRSAIHGLFHVVEWMPELRETVVSALREVVKREPNPQLRQFAEGMANDIEQGESDHVPEPVFPEEA